MANNAKMVSTGKPKTTGAVHWAPKGTGAPDSVTDALGAAFVDLGYLSEDGVSNGRNNNSIKAWGGTDVIVIREETVKFNLMQSKDIPALKLAFGDDNVLVDSQTGEITIRSAADYSQEGVLVVDMIMRGGIPRRFVVPNASVSEVGDVTYKDNEAIVYPITVKANPDADGFCHYEYQAAESGETGDTESGD
ncbi:MAG: phage tail protein [Lachnospiraceae bacterium]|nr:phage tail protein [Lachnospiraceae bacterium]